jgi:predicted metal-dependent phosphotriesterase family hydrolase
MKTIQNIVAVTGTYTNKAWEEKKQYMTVGKLFTDDQWHQSIKMESTPIWWNWWANIYNIERKSDKPKLASDTDPDDDLPW